MKEKIGIFLMALVVIWASLLIMATVSRNEQTEQPGETQQGAGQVESTQPEQPAQPGEPDETALQRVRQALEGEEFRKTARSHWVWDPELNFQENTTGFSTTTNGWALALIAAERKMNPISAFLALTREGLYSQTEDDSGVLTVAAFAVPIREAKEYAYTDAGARELVTDLLVLSSELEDGLMIETCLLGDNTAVDKGQMALDRKEGCRYGYFIASGERSTHILCFYLRSNGEGKVITDVEFQLLNLRSAKGDAQGLTELDRRGENQAATLIAAAELLITGQTQAGQGKIPFTRQVEEFTATIAWTRVTGEGEAGSMISYRLKK